MEIIPTFLKENPNVLVSRLYLDFDLYKTTLLVLTEFLPRIRRGSVFAFDELHDPEMAWQ